MTENQNEKPLVYLREGALNIAYDVIPLAAARVPPNGSIEVTMEKPIEHLLLGRFPDEMPATGHIRDEAGNEIETIPFVLRRCAAQT
jgi:hypothetical protein